MCFGLKFSDILTSGKVDKINQLVEDETVALIRLSVDDAFKNSHVDAGQPLTVHDKNAKVSRFQLFVSATRVCTPQESAQEFGNEFRRNQLTIGADFFHINMIRS